MLPDIAEYFVFNKDEGSIAASAKDAEKANYTCQILNLNGKNNKLAEARKIARIAFIRNLSALNLPIEQQKAKVIAFLSDNSNEFITFFRFVFAVNKA